MKKKFTFFELSSALEVLSCWISFISAAYKRRTQKQLKTITWTKYINLLLITFLQCGKKSAAKKWIPIFCMLIIVTQDFFLAVKPEI